MDSVNLSEWLEGYHSKTMGLGPSYFANFTSARNGCREHGLRGGDILSAKYEYSNNTLKPSACISGQGGKGEDLHGKGPEFKPALGISF